VHESGAARELSACAAGVVETLACFDGALAQAWHAGSGVDDALARVQALGNDRLLTVCSAVLPLLHASLHDAAGALGSARALIPLGRSWLLLGCLRLHALPLVIGTDPLALSRAAVQLTERDIAVELERAAVQRHVLAHLYGADGDRHVALQSARDAVTQLLAVWRDRSALVSFGHAGRSREAFTALAGSLRRFADSALSLQRVRELATAPLAHQLAAMSDALLQHAVSLARELHQPHAAASVGKQQFSLAHVVRDVATPALLAARASARGAALIADALRNGDGSHALVLAIEQLLSVASRFGSDAALAAQASDVDSQLPQSSVAGASSCRVCRSTGSARSRSAWRRTPTLV
jgi:hypothetical protein